jgi:hypothetical protein
MVSSKYNISWLDPSMSIGAAIVTYLIALNIFNTFDEDILLISSFAIFLGFLYNSVNSTISMYLDLRAQQISLLVEKLQIERANILVQGSRLMLIQSFLLNRVYSFGIQICTETLSLQNDHNAHLVSCLNSIYEDFAAFVIREKIVHTQTLFSMSLLNYTKHVNSLALLTTKTDQI